MSEITRDKYLIFDFDGTIADSFLFSIDAANQIADERGYNQLTFKDIDELRSLTLWQMIRKTKVPFWKIPELVLRIREEIYHRMSEVPLFPGLKEVIVDLKDRGYQLALVSTNSTQNVEKFLLMNDLQIFDLVRGNAGVWTKHRDIKRILKDLGIDRSQAIYIGDESRDIKACRKVGIKIVSVSWGFNTRSHLEAYKPDILIDKVEELYKVALI